MNALILLAVLIFPDPPIIPVQPPENVIVWSGALSYYDQEPSEATLQYRLDMGHIQPGYDAYIAVADCALIGHVGTMTYEVTAVTLDVQVFDCAGADGVVDGVALITSSGIACELDYEAWQEYGRGNVEVTIRQEKSPAG